MGKAIQYEINGRDKKEKWFSIYLCFNHATKYVTGELDLNDVLECEIPDKKFRVKSYVSEGCYCKKCIDEGGIK